VRALLARVRAELDGGELDTRDGVRISWPDRWLHLRASNTEPVVRLVVEAEERSAAEALRDRVLELAGQLVAR
jgi:phosphomannomutase